MDTLDSTIIQDYDNYASIARNVMREFFSEMNLENFTKQSVASTSFRYPERKENGMAIQRHKIRIGYKQDGSSKYKWLQAKNDDELNDMIVKAYIDSGRIWEFLPKQIIPVVVEEKPQKQITFKAYTETWMDTYKRPKLKPTTLRGYDSYLCAHLFPAFADMQICDIKTAIIQKWLNDRKELGKATLKKMLDLLKQILDYAVAEKVIKENPSSKLIVIPSDKVETREALTLEQVKGILNNISNLRDDDRRLMALLLLTGCRRGEVLGLRWEDIDVTSGMIHVQRNVTYVKNQPSVGTPKTEKGKRFIPLDAQLLSFLTPVQTTGYIIGGGDMPISRMSFRRQWERIEKNVNLHRATSHVFRHSYLTMLAGTGVDVKTLQTIGGHADIQTTMNRYVHPVASNIVDAGSRMNKLLTTQ